MDRWPMSVFKTHSSRSLRDPSRGARKRAPLIASAILVDGGDPREPSGYGQQSGQRFNRKDLEVPADTWLSVGIGRVDVALTNQDSNSGSETGSARRGNRSGGIERQNDRSVGHQCRALSRRHTASPKFRSQSVITDALATCGGDVGRSRLSGTPTIDAAETTPAAKTRRQTSSAVAREHRSFDSPSYNWLTPPRGTMAVALSDDTHRLPTASSHLVDAGRPRRRPDTVQVIDIVVQK